MRLKVFDNLYTFERFGRFDKNRENFIYKDVGLHEP